MSEDIATQTRLALRRLAKSVAVLTTRWRDQRCAMAATAVEGLSLDPPSMLVCVARNASLAEPLAAGTAFAINLLARRQQDIASRGAAPWRGEERFTLGEWDGHGDAPPILRGAQASFCCTPAAKMEYGTHLVVIGRIDAVRIAGEVDPLIYADGRFGGLAVAAGTR